MKRAIPFAVATLVAASVGAVPPALGQEAEEPAADGQTTAAQAAETGELDHYSATVSPEKAAELAEEGIDIVETRQSEDRVEVDAILSQSQRQRVATRTGVDMEPVLNADGLTAQQAATLQEQEGYDVWRSWDEPGGIRDEVDQIAADHPNLVKRVVLGETHEGREIVALKVTVGAPRVRDGRRPAVLHLSAQHSREWISVEVNRRLLHWMLDEYEAGNSEVRGLLASTETWFVLVANPDGYQHTFDGERLWRKNLRDNDGDGEITLADGVDLNRNFDSRWGYDEEGSSSVISSDTHRGPAPASEPETVAMQDLIQRIEPRFLSNWHSYGNWILYPQGWQTGTLDADNPVYAALAGTDADPAIPGFDPGPAADELYVTNGEMTDYASDHGAIAFTPELGEGSTDAGFVFPDDEGLIQAEFKNTLEFSLGLSRSARTPADPSSPVGITTEPFYLDQAGIDPENSALSMFDFRFDVSYGDPQPVRVLAKRSLGKVTAKYRINGGRVQRTKTSEWKGGERYDSGGATYYRVMEGKVTGAAPGDTVEVWFEARGQSSDSFTYTVESDTGNDVLVLAAEDYTGAAPAYDDQSGPNYVDFYTDALEANEVTFDVYDVDAHDRTAASAVGVLSHYDAVIWYTGDDIVTREPGWAAGNASSEAVTTLFAVRDYLNEGGRVLYDGKWAGQQFTADVGQLYDPFENQECLADPEITERCRLLVGSGDLQNDVLQYWLGAGFANVGGGNDPETGGVFAGLGVDEPLADLTWGFNGEDSAGNQDHSGSFVTTSGLLPVEDFPQFESWVAAEYDRPGGPFEPRSGEHYLYSNIGDASYKRLTRTIPVPAEGATLSFWSSQATEVAWDHFFVEARTAGQEDWTTLPDANGNTTQEPGDSCPEGWHALHPHLEHYQTLDPGSGEEGPTCTPTGTTGEWHASSGNSSGWQEWVIDLSGYAGSQVEVSLSYASDWAVQGLGVFLEDIELSTGEGSTDFETEDLGGWEISEPPPGSPPNPNDFERITAAGFTEGAVVATEDTLLMGFGLEGVTDAGTRAELMGRALSHLLH